jgi:hypothetical protein
VDAGGIIAIVVGLAGLGGVLFTAMRFNRDDTTAVVSQQSTILHDMQALNAELRTTNGELRDQVAQLRAQIGRIRGL